MAVLTSLNRRDLVRLLLAASGSAVLPGSTAVGLEAGRSASERAASEAAPGHAPAKSGDAVEPAFQWLMLGEVKPAGWIREQMLGDLRHGFAGCLDKLCVEASSDIFVSHRSTQDRQNVANANGSDWWNGETEGNWRAGFMMMAYLTGDATAMREADAYVQHILSSQGADGYLGAFAPDARYLHPGELWTQACLLRGLLDYAELSGNIAVREAVQRATDLTVSAYGTGKKEFPWGENHDLMICDVMERLYDLTGESKYLDFMLWHYEQWSSVDAKADMSLESLLDRSKGFHGHGVRVYESIRVPLWLWMASGREDLGVAAQNALDKLSRYGEPGGSAVSEEMIDNLRPDPTLTEYEYCATKEIQFTLESALQKTGQAEIGDSIEHIWFNAAQGSRLADGRAITYLTSDNRLRCDGKMPDGSRSQPRNKFSPTHADVAVCCNPNAANVAPLYVRGMWMRRRDGLAALLYGACRVATKVGGVRVAIEEKTSYPFDNIVEMEIQPERPVAFPLLLRNPGWSRGTVVQCAGAQVARTGEYWVVTKQWEAGDKVRLEFSPQVEAIQAVNGEVALRYGALLFAGPIASQRTVVKTYAVAGFEDTYLEPAPANHEELALPAQRRWEQFGFEPRWPANGANPLRPFETPVVVLQGKMIRKTDGMETEVTLVPLGNAPLLRRLTFPVR